MGCREAVAVEPASTCALWPPAHCGSHGIDAELHVTVEGDHMRLDGTREDAPSLLLAVVAGAVNRFSEAVRDCSAVTPRPTLASSAAT